MKRYIVYYTSGLELIVDAAHHDIPIIGYNTDSRLSYWHVGNSRFPYELVAAIIDRGTSPIATKENP